jgi:hypothetical protein
VSADGELAVGIALAGALGWFWLVSGRLQEAQSWYADLPTGSPCWRGCAPAQERLAKAQALLEEARAVWSQVEATYGSRSPA